MRFPLLAPGLVLIALAACSPTLDWRAMRLGPDAKLQFPCKPDRLERQLRLDDRPAAAQMLVCDAAGATWSATLFDMGAPDAALATLDRLPESLAVNLQLAGANAASPAGPATGTRRAVHIPGATPQRPALRLTLEGHRPDGSATRAEALFVARGPRVYQLVVLMPHDRGSPAQAATAEFLDALRWPD